ncbi:HipA domain-containing protein [Chitinophagaceae bacterium LB-8]|uniref:HipA domain-containing protein n=1 Tax=Paraflavisolibacter caeni TaxID=2982496 RepID=A0A9X2XV70_9BACT|nr:HipA domain-containing protein [Paraflavisolibacter caeni]MCU7549904.1 HipA domain-containing protein [Paraflavisolibacter caeni]
MSCPGCYKKGTGRFCRRCRHELFDGARIAAVLPFETPNDSNLAQYQERTKRLSISGVQLKYSLRLEEGQFVLTDRNGAYILKPIPPLPLSLIDQAPENEHLTMQIARQVYGMSTAFNALLRFKDGAPAYITRRFDIVTDKGIRYLQEDFAQLSGRTRKSHGENFKYEGSYEEIGILIRKYIAAAVPALEAYFRLVLFNYLFSNGDAHLKNFSITRTPYGDYGLTPAYDLMCTVLHTEGESDTALELYQDDMEDPFYQSYGFYGRPHFEELARRIGILPRRAAAIIDHLLSKTDKVMEMIEGSYLSASPKERYTHYYLDKVRRFEVEKGIM